MIRIGAVVLSCLFVLFAGSAQVREPPEWAYPVKPADFAPTADDGAARKIRGSAGSYTAAQMNDPFLAVDWHPEEHPPMPEVVAHGRKPGVLACGYCHRADSPGGPENAGIAALSYAYILQQL